MTAISGDRDIGDFDDRFVAKLNRLGENGWDLVSVINQPWLSSSQYNLLTISWKTL